MKRELLEEYQCTKDIYEVLTAYKNFEYNIKNIEPLDKSYCEEVIKYLAKNDIKIVKINDKNYPKELLNYDDMPSILFYKGDIEPLNKNENVAIVGSRNPTNYGIDVAEIITKYLCKKEISLVSGLAKGVDAVVHKISCDKNNYTCAVIGSGIDVTYPYSNKELYKRIINNGCILSEFPLHTKPLSYNFPRRNRIISALSKRIIVVEASEKSGSLITAGHGLDQGKEIIAVPGSIFSEQSKGTNKLISDGAIPFLSLDTLRETLSISIDKNENMCNNNRDNTWSLSEVESRIFENLSDSPIHVDDLISMVNIDINQIYKVLFEMQAKNLIYTLSGNYYAKKYTSV
ncbi:DNA-processing protein DprA [Clostridium cellulovorans]|uniref:DNA protecting protein DprA n=1 Tax=Clostridium cellulovorans (strain ATCC 35296 / DSM 3052 / OCM 3 / 743B) TaxID=573061 RepID=D9SKL9_CLOC7|nr:DNA-processing protein DprA [Clostridium cellulovorans]ADL51515.1 DNA protecting protein DprA [Clostridium cellulovorans 743B]